MSPVGSDTRSGIGLPYEGPLPGPILVVGASHQGEVVLDLIRALPHPPQIHGFLDCCEDGGFVGRQVGGIPVLDTVNSLDKYRGVVVGAIPAVGDVNEREHIAAALERAGIPMFAAVHPCAHVASDVQIGPGTVVLAGAILGVGSRVGRAAIINTGAIVDHHCRVGDYAHIAPGVRMAGGIRVGERAWVGLGATILEDICIGPDAEIGAGSVVTRDVHAGNTVIGVPARPFTDRERTHPEKDLV